MGDGGEAAQWKITSVDGAVCRSLGVDDEALVNGGFGGGQGERFASGWDGREGGDIPCGDLVFIEFEVLVCPQGDDSAFRRWCTWVDMKITETNGY